MRVTSLVCAVFILVGSVGTILLTGCADPSASDQRGNSVAPTIDQLIPNVVPVGSGDFELMINGEGFVPGSTVEWGGRVLSTEYLSPTHLSASVRGAQIADTGEVQVSVVNPPPDGGVSETAIFFRPAPSSLEFQNRTYPIIGALASRQAEYCVGRFCTMWSLAVRFLTEGTRTCGDLNGPLVGAEAYYARTTPAQRPEDLVLEDSGPYVVAFSVGGQSTGEVVTLPFPGEITSVDADTRSVRGWVRAQGVGPDNEGSLDVEFIATLCGS